MNMGQNLVLGADIGGSHITVAVVDLATNSIVNSTKSRLELNAKGDLTSILNAWQKAIEQCCQLAGGQSFLIGIAMPGPLDYQKGISLIKGQDKYDALFGLNIKTLLAERLTICEENISFVNDAVAFLQGEILGGAAKEGKNIIGLTLGTGLGSAKFLNNLPVTDADLWKMPFRDSIAEEYLATRWFLQRYQELTGKCIGNVKELVVLATAGEAEALVVFAEFGTNLGIFLKLFIEMEGEIDTVVLGGNIAKASHLFTSEILQVLQKAGKVITIKQTLLGEDAALLGAAGLWKTTLEKEMA
jgi:glucokinase